MSFRSRTGIVFLFCFLVYQALASEPVSETNSKSADSLYRKPHLDKASYYLFEAFPTGNELTSDPRWIRSQSRKNNVAEEIEKYDGEWEVGSTNVSRMEGDFGLILKSAAKHHGIAVRLDRPYEFNGKPFVFQYDVKFTNGQECGGAYVKLLQKDSLNNLKELNDKTPYTIMFGPDKCGKEAHLRFIFQHRNPLTGVYQEKHWKEPNSMKIEEQISSKTTHLYTLIINPDSTFQIFVDEKIVGDGSLLHDVTPPVNPVKEIDDPEERKPIDWDEHKTIPDPNAVKPENWDENAPKMIEDPSVSKPEGWLEDEAEMIPDEKVPPPDDWDVEMDGDWEAPLIENPKCKAVGCGKWTAPLIDNPKCKEGCGPWVAPTIENPNYMVLGKWMPKKIANPHYFEDLEPYKMTSIDALALELWSISNNVVFDNFLLTDDPSVASNLTAQTWRIKASAQSSADSIFSGHVGNYAVIGVAVAVFIGLLTMVLYRNVFRRRALVEQVEPLNPGVSDAVPKKESETSEAATHQKEKKIGKSSLEEETLESASSRSEESDSDENSMPSSLQEAIPEIEEPVLTKRSRARRE